ncbi:MAG: divalent-cation tolerance protein CutA [Leptospira sp.]|nr:divalent-cation tolerance protein CutA [Leptospira sp.]
MNQNTEDLYMVYVTTANESEAEQIATVVVSENLAVCGNIIPAITSIYKWEGKLNREKESLLILKAKDTQIQSLFERIKALHSYDVPCIISYRSASVDPSYLDWVRNSL